MCALTEVHACRFQVTITGNALIEADLPVTGLLAAKNGLHANDSRSSGGRRVQNRRVGVRGCVVEPDCHFVKALGQVKREPSSRVACQIGRLGTACRAPAIHAERVNVNAICLVLCTVPSASSVFIFVTTFRDRCLLGVAGGDHEG